MNKRSMQLAALTMLGVFSAAGVQAQTTPPTPDRPVLDGPSTTTPNATTPPNAITPPDGVARGVIRPDPSIGSDMVTTPPAQGGNMPVITPPGTAR